jgi:hypothetical protein
VIDANGVIRANGLVFLEEIHEKPVDKSIESLVAEAEKASKRKSMISTGQPTPVRNRRCHIAQKWGNLS